jgi:sodium-coupled neutral amino acid transporter 11
MKDLSALAPTSMLSLLSVVFLVTVMCARMFDGSYAPGGQFYEEMPKLAPAAPLSQWFEFGLPSLVLMNALAMAFLPHYNGCKYYRELKNHHPYRFLTCTAMGMGSVATLYVVAMLVGQHTFGSNTKPVITESYSRNDVLINMARLCMGLSILFSFPIMFSGLREACLKLLEDFGQINCEQVWKQDIFSLCMVVFIAFLSSILKETGMVVGLVGAICGYSIIFLVPCTLYAAAVRVDVMETHPHQQVLLTRVLSALGILLIIGGVYATLVFP